MRNFLFAAALSAGALCLNVGQASAGLLGCCCCKKCCTICCRPYNAFSPVCCGTLFCNGCCPCPQPCCNQGPPPPTCCPDACGGCGAGPNFLPGGATPPMTGTPPATMPGGQQFTPPAPQQLPQGAGARAYLPARPFAPPVQPVGYYPYAYPYANPYAGYPAAAPMAVQPMSVPSYWYQR